MYGWMFCFGVMLPLHLQFTYGFGRIRQRIHQGFGYAQDEQYINHQNLTGFKVHGKRARPGQFPGSAALRHANGSLFCTGTILHTKWVLTAATCLSKKDTRKLWWVTAGDIQWHPEAEMNDSMSVQKVIDIVEHPNWIKTRAIAWDISLLKVDPGFEFDEIFIKRTPIIKYKVNIGKRCVVHRWGRKNSTLTKEINYLQWMDTEVKKKSTDELIYFQDPKRKAFVCFGDAGTGYLCDGMVAAVMSGTTKGNCSIYGIGMAAGVLKVRLWIRKIIGEKLYSAEGSITRVDQFLLPALMLAFYTCSL